MSDEKSIVVKRETVDVVASRIRQFQASGEIHLPENYSADNAIKSAWLIIQQAEDRSKQPALKVCSKESIANALLYMIVKGLNPAKKQCYFIVYGKKLICQDSYFGTMAITKRINPKIDDIIAEVVYKGDTFEFEIKKGRKFVSLHKQTLESIGGEVVAAYCMILDKDGNPMRTEIMTIKQIKQAWKQSKMNPVDDRTGDLKSGSTHAKFTEEMAKKTVINRCCKPILNASDDSDLVIKNLKKANEIQADAKVESDIEENANQELIDIEPADPAQDEYDSWPDTGIDGDTENGEVETTGADLGEEPDF